MEQLKIGQFTLTWLDGGVTNLDGGAMFGVVPKALWSKKYPVNDRNQIELRTDPILLQAGGKNIVIESAIWMAFSPSLSIVIIAWPLLWPPV